MSAVFKKQQELPLDYNKFHPEKFIHSSLFNEVYVLKDIPLEYQGIWQDIDPNGFREFYDQFISFCESVDAKEINKADHTGTIEEWIGPIMGFLGWDEYASKRNGIINNTNLNIVDSDGSSQTIRPSLLFCEDEKGKDYILADKSSDKCLQALRMYLKLPVTTGYFNSWADRKSGRYDHKRDEIGKRGDVFSNLGVNEQMAEYLNIFQNKSWGISTDGAIWRLFRKEEVASDNEKYFEFNLKELFDLIRTSHVDADDEQGDFFQAAKYFYWFFSKEALSSGVVPFVSKVYKESKKYIDQIEDDLRERFVHAMTIACNGYLKDSRNKGVKDPDIKLIAKTSESLIFNLIFIRSCESKRILPMHQDYLPVSLKKLIDKIRDFSEDQPWEYAGDFVKTRLKKLFGKKVKDDGFEIYNYIQESHKIVENGDNGFGITGFIESVFYEEERKFYNKFKIDNENMVRMLFQLFYVREERRSSQIPYNLISPRQLGSIYESFLEFQPEYTDVKLYFLKKTVKQKNIWQWVNKEKLSKKIPENTYCVDKGDLIFSPNNKDRKTAGSYYTPAKTVDYIVKEILEPKCANATKDEILNIKVCDPAMGSGHFLIGALNFLYKKYVELGQENKGAHEIKRDILHSCIFGVDANSSAIKLGKLSLWLQTAYPGKKLERLDDQLKNGDSLVGSMKGYHLSFNWKQQFDDVIFDAFLGNPPWITFAGKEKVDDTYDIAYLEYLKINYPDSSGYKLNSYAMFLERIVKLYPESSIGLVVPRTLLDNKYNRDIRRFLFGEKKGASVKLLPVDTFDGVTVESISLILSDDISGIHVLDEDSRHIVKHEVEIILKEPDAVIPYKVLSKKHEEILDASISVDSLFRVYVGVVTGDNKKYLSKDAKGTKYRPILKGADLAKGGYKWSGTYILWDTKKLHSNLDESVYLADCKILVRKTGAKIISCVDFERKFTEQTIYNLVPKGKMSKIEVKFYSVLLNSQVIQDIYLKLFITNEKAYPYIKGIHLKRFPLVKFDGSSRHKAISLMYGNDRLSENDMKAIEDCYLENVKN
jgi:type I restriction-modification system DNA methylase subunit